MADWGGPAQPSPTIGRCPNGDLGWLEVKYSEPASRCDPTIVQHADLEIGSRALAPSAARPFSVAHKQRVNSGRDRVAQIDALIELGTPKRRILQLIGDSSKL
jgi:hypothetical protein